ncbi:hypothetical protein ABUW04_14185 [Streptacidiphilus sp. N1-10]|uniref:Gram-positive cocci surface proteins LPxTG domain-containing protein n=1 Tax=Streptacidiphilus jeojiensis TaxID=3229225 RepID=A0ABV6XMV1_9ACTN
MSAYLSSRIAKNITAVAVVAAALGVAGAGAAQAQTNCGGDTVIVDRPGAHPVKNAPVHHGGISLGYSAPIAPMTVGSPWEFTLSEYNGTGAGYRNVAVEPSFMGWVSVGGDRLGGMTPANTHLQALIGGVWKNVPLATGCDPAMGINSTVVDHPLAAGAHWSQKFRLTVDPGVAAQLTSFDFLDAVIADGSDQFVKPSGDNGDPIAVTRPAASSTSTSTPSASVTATHSAGASPTSSASASAKASAPATTAPATTAPVTTPASTSPATGAPQLARTGASTPTTPLAALGAGLLALGGLVVTLSLRLRRGRRG